MGCTFAEPMSNVYIPPSEHPRLVIIGAGFAGIQLAKKLKNKPFQVVLLDRNNFHQFQPLFYQVATSGLEPDSIVFSVRKIFRNQENVVVRMAEAESINTAINVLYTNEGDLSFDYLVIATGTTNNYYGLNNVELNAVGLKTIQESLNIRSLTLQNLEKAAISGRLERKDSLTNIVVVGGGPAGVEMAGAFAEFKRFTFKKDYPDVNTDMVKIFLVEAGPTLLPTMSAKSGKHALDVLKRLEVEVLLNTSVKNFDGEVVELSNGKIAAATMVWTAGIQGQYPTGLGAGAKLKGNRIAVDRYNRIKGYENIYAIGDVAAMVTHKYPFGHPQVAPAAIQQGINLAKNLCREDVIDWKTFEYFDKGALATIGKKKAVLDLGRLHMKGFTAWFVWATVHLFSISGFKNKLRVGINWMSSYFSYDKRNRLIIRPFKKKA